MLDTSFHCMAHPLELAVKDSVDSVNSVSHFSILVNDMYKVFRLSLKNLREFVVASDLIYTWS